MPGKQETGKKRSNRINFRLTAALIVVITAVTLPLSGCITAKPRTSLPIQPPESFSLRGQAPPDQKWWLDFGDDSLSELIQTALTDNFDLLRTRDRILEVEAQAKQAGAFLRPSADVSGNATTSRDYQTNSTTNNFFLGLAASYEVDLWGRLRATRNATLAELGAAEADYATAALTLAAEVAVSWFELVENRQQIELLKKQQETNSKVLEVITAQFRTGKAGVADVLQQRQLVESNRGILAELRAAGRLLKHQLLVLLAQPPASTLPATEQLPSLPQLPDSGIPLELLGRRPDVNSSYLKLQAADSRVASAIADRFPQLGISAGLSTSGDRTKDLFSDWFTNLGANLFGPLIDGGIRKAEVDRRKAIARQRYYGYGQTLLNALVEVEDSLVREKELQSVLKSLRTQLQLAAETIDHVGTRYRQGAEDYQRVLLALLSHQNLQRDILNNHKRLVNNRVALYRALSGGITTDSSQPQQSGVTTPADTMIQSTFQNGNTQ